MKNLLVMATIAGLAIVAITYHAWSWFCTVLGIALALAIVRNSRLTIKIQLIVVGALAGGLGAEILAVAYRASADEISIAGAYKETIMLALGSAIVVFAAMMLESIVQKLLTLKNRQ